MGTELAKFRSFFGFNADSARIESVPNPLSRPLGSVFASLSPRLSTPDGVPFCQNGSQMPYMPRAASRS